MTKQKQKPKSAVISIEENKYLLWALLASFLLCIFLASSFKISADDDFFWHLATGRFIVENKFVPDKDVFGITSAATVWVPFEWGWDVLTYSLYQMGGYNAILVFRSIIITLIILIYFLLLKKFKVNSALNIFLLFVLLIFYFPCITVLLYGLLFINNSHLYSAFVS